MSEVAQSCPTLYDPMNCSPPGSSVHGIFQAWILEWVAISFSRGSSWPRDWTQVSCIVGRHFTVQVTREAPSLFLVAVIICLMIIYHIRDYIQLEHWFSESIVRNNSYSIITLIMCCALCLVTQLCLFATPWTTAHQALLSLGILQARVLEWVALLQGIFPTQGLNPCIPLSR